MTESTGRALAAACAALLLHGCTVVPGSDLGVGGLGGRGAWLGAGDWFPGIRAGGPPAPAESVNLVPVTLRLLEDAPRLTRPAAAEPVPAAMAPETASRLAGYEYRLAPGDIIDIVVYEHPELTLRVGGGRTVEEAGIVVESDGAVFFPYIGEVAVEGLTAREVRRMVAGRLAEYISSPQVDVKVLGYRSKRVYVTGQVAEPGPQAITNVPMTVADAISMAGGLTEDANWHDALLSRDGEETRISLYEMFYHGRMGGNLLLEHRDVLHVPEQGVREVYVLGEPNEVSIVPMGSMPMSLTEALAAAGGINQETSDASGIFVIRDAEGEGGEEGGEGAGGRGIDVYQLDVRNAVAYALGSRFMMWPGDIVYITTAPVTRWNRVVRQIANSVTTVLGLNAILE